MEERKEHETEKRNERWRIGKERNRKKGKVERKEYEKKGMERKEKNMIRKI